MTFKDVTCIIRHTFNQIQTIFYKIFVIFVKILLFEVQDFKILFLDIFLNFSKII